MMTVHLTLVETVSFATAILWLGMFLRGRVGILGKYNIPAPVIGGVLFALLSWAFKNYFIFDFDMTVKDPLMITFFTTIGLAASFSLLRRGGPQVFIFLAVAAVLVIFQDVVAVALSLIMEIPPALGILAGSVTMSGGHGTGAVYAQLFNKQFGLHGGMELAMAAATCGLIIGSILGGPLARKLIEGKRLTSPNLHKDGINYNLASEDSETDNDPPVTASILMVTLMQITIAMSVGTLIYDLLVEIKIQLPTYLCALFVGIFIRNLSDMTGLYKVHHRLADTIGSVALSLFLALSLMSLKLWQLADLAGPMVVILVGETLLMGFYAYFVTFRIMGGDYTAAVIAGGHCGFGMGATPNAIANMDAITSNYGPAPRAFFVVSIVGAFFIDIVNAIVIQSFVAMM